MNHFMWNSREKNNFIRIPGIVTANYKLFSLVKLYQKSILSLKKSKCENRLSIRLLLSLFCDVGNYFPPPLCTCMLFILAAKLCMMQVVY